MATVALTNMHPLAKPPAKPPAEEPPGAPLRQTASGRPRCARW